MDEDKKVPSLKDVLSGAGIALLGVLGGMILMYAMMSSPRNDPPSPDPKHLVSPAPKPLDERQIRSIVREEIRAREAAEEEREERVKQLTRTKLEDYLRERAVRDQTAESAEGTIRDVMRMLEERREGYSNPTREEIDKLLDGTKVKEDDK